MRRISAIVVDDESSGRDAIRQLCAIVAPQIELIAEASSVATASSLLKDVSPDVIFLDVKMGDGTGFDLLARLKIAAQVIFVTAFDQFAIQALRLAAVDYLLKPVDPSELAAAINRVEQRRQSSATVLDAEQLSMLMQSIGSRATAPHQIAVPVSDGYQFLKLDQIRYLTAESNYTRIMYSGRESFLVARTLGDLEESLPPAMFLRIHQSHIVNMQYVQRYVRGKGGHVVLADGTSLDVAARRKGLIMQLLHGES